MDDMSLSLLSYSSCHSCTVVLHIFLRLNCSIHTFFCRSHLLYYSFFTNSYCNFYTRLLLAAVTVNFTIMGRIKDDLILIFIYIYFKAFPLLTKNLNKFRTWLPPLSHSQFNLHITPIIQHLYWLPIQHQIHFKILPIANKFLNNLIPVSLPSFKHQLKTLKLPLLPPLSVWNFVLSVIEYLE